MKICLMSSWPSVHTHYWLKALVERGHEVHFLSPFQQETSLIDLPKGVRSHTFSKGGIRGTGSLVMSFELRKKLRQINPDVFHIHSVFAVRGWRLFPLVAAMSSFHPLIITAWGGDLLRTPRISRSGRFFVRLALSRADIITADSESLLNAARELGARKDKLREIQFGVDTAVFTPDVNTSPLHSMLQLGPGPIIYSPRAFMPIYNQLMIAQAIPAVLQQYPEAKFIFKRRSDHHSPETEGQVLRVIKELNVTDAVRIIPDLPSDQLPALYALSDIVVSVPDFDGTPRSVLEAMSCGAFPVVSNLAALREWINQGENGLFVSVTNAEQIALAIIKALSASDTLTKARFKNRDLIQRGASSKYWVGKMEELYRLLILKPANLEQGTS
jgi:glycosyltransferase involved in cell wall biosynthesis